MDVRYSHVLCLVVKDGKILLGRKRTGHGKGKWNGFGGKIEASESPQAAAIRECQEEAGIIAHIIQPVGTLLFKYSDAVKGEYEHTVALFLVTSFEGKPLVTAEMDTPTWFSYTEVPYASMWEDDAYWLPAVLEGKRVKGTFLFTREYVLAEKQVTIY